MTFGDNSSGFSNENEIINYINDTKYFDNLNANFKDFLLFTFNSNLSGCTMSSYKLCGQIKPDIAIKINNITKFISVKKGTGNSVHQENLEDFIYFLCCNNVDETVITYLKQFHYGDGSIDGNGGARMSGHNFLLQYPNKMYVINNALNKHDILEKIIKRVIFIGNIPNAPKADAIYHGNINSGLWASYDEIMEYLLFQCRGNNSSIHISALVYQVWNRNLNNNPKTSNRRHVMQIKWGSLTKDLNNILEKRK